MRKDQIYQTDRLILRPTNDEDGEFIFKLMNTPKWLQFIGDRNIWTLQDAHNYIAEKIRPQYERLGYGNYTVIRKADGAKLGNCGLYDREGLEGVDIGFAFLPDHEKQGYAFEAAQKVKQLAFEVFDLAHIGAITDEQNTASQKLLDKIGLTFIEVITLPDSEEQVMYYQLDKTAYDSGDI